MHIWEQLVKDTIDVHSKVIAIPSFYQRIFGPEGTGKLPAGVALVRDCQGGTEC